MAYATHHDVLTGLSGREVTKKSGLARRLVEAVRQWREKQANRDVADFIERAGGRLTDNLEREMTQRFLIGNRNFRQ